jgi:hypothetical protein
MPITQDRMLAIIEAARASFDRDQAIRKVASGLNRNIPAINSILAMLTALPSLEIEAQVLRNLVTSIAEVVEYIHETQTEASEDFVTIAREEAHFKATSSRNIRQRRYRQRKRFAVTTGSEIISPRMTEAELDAWPSAPLQQDDSAMTYAYANPSFTPPRERDAALPEAIPTNKDLL